MSTQFSTALVQAAGRSRGFASGHRYTLEEYGLSEQMIEQRFAEIYRQRTFGRDGNEGSARKAGDDA